MGRETRGQNGKRKREREETKEGMEGKWNRTKVGDMGGEKGK
jgi:hypothetical protein